jgi:hypothetical protein
MLLLALGYGLGGSVIAADVTEAPVTLPLSLYIVDEAGASPTSELSSRRDDESLAQVLERMRGIWAQAGIELALDTIARIEAPADALSALGRGDTTAFLNGLIDGTIEVPNPGIVNGFYVRSLGRINGIAPGGSRLFFVTDEPSVHDERVSSHEIGHILGLHHQISANDRLMFSGTNGMELANDEVATARYVAQGIIDGLR